MKEVVFINAAGTNSYTASPTPTVEELKRNVIVVAKFANNNTGAATLSLNGGAAVPIWRDGSAVTTSDAISASYHYLLAYDGIVFHIVGTSSVSGGGGGATSLNELSDVTISGAASGDLLRHDGTDFKNTPFAASLLPSGIDATKIGAGAVSNTEFGYLDGVTSALQTQIDGKAATSHSHAASDITSGVIATAHLGTGTADSSTFLRGDGTWAAGGGGATQLDDLSDVTISSVASGHTLVHNGTAFVNRVLAESDIPSLAASKIGSGTLDSARLGSGTANSTTWLRGDGAWTALSDSVMPSGIDAAKIGAGNVSNTEFDRLNGVTSAIQTQLDTKAATSHTHAASDIASGQVALARGGTGSDLSATGGAGQVLKQSSAGGAVSVGALSASDIPNLDASKITTGTIATARLASGTADSNSYLRGDNFWGGLNASHLESGQVPVERIYTTLASRSPSTNYDLLAVDSGTNGQLIVIDDTMNANTVTLVRLVDGAIAQIVGDTGCYITTSPTGDQCQVTITGGYIRFTTGSGYSRKMGISTSQIGRG